MLYFIYQRLIVVLEWLGKIFRSTESSEKRLKRIEKKQEEHGLILEEIRRSVVPDQATQLTLTAGPTEEQP